MVPRSWIWLYVCLLLTGCGGGFAAKADRSLRYAYAATTAARDSFTAWDKQHQIDLVAAATSRESGEAALAAYRVRRQAVVASFTAAYTALAAAAAALPLLGGGRTTAQVAALLTEVAGAVAAVQAAVAEMEKP